MRKLLPLVMLVLALHVSAGKSFGAVITNGSFSPNFNGWTTSFGTAPNQLSSAVESVNDGGFIATFGDSTLSQFNTVFRNAFNLQGPNNEASTLFLNYGQGSFVFQDIHVTQPGDLSFDWQAFANEVDGKSFFAWILTPIDSLGGSPTSAGTYNNLATSSNATPWTSGTYTIDGLTLEGDTNSVPNFSASTGSKSLQYGFNDGDEDFYRLGFAAWISPDNLDSTAAGLLVSGVSFSSASSPQSVPEPATLVTSAFGLLVLGYRRRRNRKLCSLVSENTKA